MVGHSPPANVIFRLCFPDVAFSFDSSKRGGGSFIFVAGFSATGSLDQAEISIGSSKSKTILSPGVDFSSAPAMAAAITMRRPWKVDNLFLRAVISAFGSGGVRSRGNLYISSEYGGSKEFPDS